MQIVRTGVTDATACDGWPMLRVMSCGEGSECVAVDMMGADGKSEDTIPARTATFGLAAKNSGLLGAVDMAKAEAARQASRQRTVGGDRAWPRRG